MISFPTAIGDPHYPAVGKKSEMQLVENRATAFMTWDARVPTSYDACILCGGGKSSLHRRPGGSYCFLFHFCAGEGMPGVFTFEDVTCDAGCGRKFGPDLWHDYFFCLPCNSAACGPCFRAADRVLLEGERPPPEVVRARSADDARRLCRKLDRERRLDSRAAAAAAATAGESVVLGSESRSLCATCGAKGSQLLACSRCRLVFYCGPACQRADWKVHKSSCASARSETAAK